MRRKITTGIGLITGTLVALPLMLHPAAAEEPAVQPEEPSILATTPRHRQVARMVTRFVERAHYSRVDVDDELSAAVLETYLDALDSNHHYFLEPDILFFSRYRHRLDDALKTGELEPVFDIFRLYRLRAQESLNVALETLESEPDFTIDETYFFDRSELPWPADRQQAAGIWERRVKNDAIGLQLADKTWEESSEVLSKRYLRVLKRINRLDSDDVFETFMNAFARTLDPHSSYLSPRQSEEYRIQMSLSYQGIGASLLLDDEYVTVRDVIPGGPAAIDGRMEALDRIIAVGQGTEEALVDVVGWELDDVVQLIRGPSGSTVRLEILPAGALPGDESYVLDLVRNRIKLEEQAARSEIIEVPRGDGTVKIGVLDVPSFYQDYEARSRGDEDYTSTSRDVEKLIAELKDEGVKGLVMDLRGNGGGHLWEARALSGLFISGGPVVQIKDTNGRVEVLDDPLNEAAWSGPLVVLVDRFSASASEIFAAAIQDYQRGVVIGQQTFGKGTVQNLYVLDQYARTVPEPGLGQLTLTIGKYYRVTGGSTQNRGVQPDIDLPTAVDLSQVGESTRPSALPWDRIASAEYDAAPPLDSTIAALAVEQTGRAYADPDFQYMLSDIEAVSELRERRSVSLNLETRRQERESLSQERLDRENARRDAAGLDPLADLQELDQDEIPDVLLNQAAQVTADIVDIDNGERPVMSVQGETRVRSGVSGHQN